MSRPPFDLRSIFCAALLSAVATLTHQFLNAQKGPVPSAILASKTVFVSNVGPDTEDMSAYVSREPNRVYDDFYTALKNSGKFEIIGDPSDADLVLEPRVANQRDGGAYLTLVIYDRKTHYVLWTLTHRIKGCNSQKACIDNFDAAIPGLLLDLEKLAGKASPEAH
jgi:hypothetical protein